MSYMFPSVPLQFHRNMFALKALPPTPVSSAKSWSPRQIALLLVRNPYQCARRVSVIWFTERIAKAGWLLQWRNRSLEIGVRRDALGIDRRFERDQGAE